MQNVTPCPSTPTQKVSLKKKYARQFLYAKREVGDWKQLRFRTPTWLEIAKPASQGLFSHNNFRETPPFPVFPPHFPTPNHERKEEGGGGLFSTIPSYVWKWLRRRGLKMAPVKKKLPPTTLFLPHVRNKKIRTEKKEERETNKRGSVPFL